VINNISKKCSTPPSDRSANGELKLASFCSSGAHCRPQKMLKHLLLHSIIIDFIGALGVLNFSKDTLRVQMIAVALGRLEFVHPHALSGVHYLPPPPPCNRQLYKQNNIAFLRYFLTNHGKTPSTVRNSFFNKNQTNKEC